MSAKNFLGASPRTSLEEFRTPLPPNSLTVWRTCFALLHTPHFARNFHRWSCFYIFPTLHHLPMDTSSLIRHRLDVEILRGKFVKIWSLLKGESTWKLWHRFDVEISMWIRHSKTTKYRWGLHVDFSMSLRRQIDVTALLAVSIPSFSNIFFSGNLF